MLVGDRSSVAYYVRALLHNAPVVIIIITSTRSYFRMRYFKSYYILELSKDK
jgi:hypothetical protein